MGMDSARPGLIILVAGIMGFIMAAILQVAYDSSFIIHNYCTSAELPGLQVMVIVLFMLSGGALAAVTSR